MSTKSISCMLNASILSISTGVQLQCPEHGVSIEGGKGLKTFTEVTQWISCSRKCRETIGCRYWTWYNWYKPLRIGSFCVTYTDTTIPRFVTGKTQYEGAISGARNCGSISNYQHAHQPTIEFHFVFVNLLASKLPQLLQ